MLKNNIIEIIKDIKDGKMVIILDDESRENEGDLVCAADLVTPEIINFMASKGKGLICLPMSTNLCEKYDLQMMTSNNKAANRTAFTVSIEATKGITTGISAHDRAKTVQTAVSKNASPDQLSQPGHIFPIMSQPGGVLTRAGHTEAGCDLARLAGFEPAATIVEILNEDGSMARRPDLESFSKKHDIKIGTIADLIRYRLEKERYIERISKKKVETEFGEFTLYCYDDQVNQSVHVALVKGKPKSSDEPLVRVHIQDTLGDVLSVQAASLGWPIRDAIRRISEEENGIVVILREQESSRDLMDAINGLTKENKQVKSGKFSEESLRTYGIGAQILRDLGIKKMRVLSAPKQMYAISGFDLKITEYVEK